MTASGIRSYGTYVPRFRLAHAEIGQALTGSGRGSGARLVAGFDEDATTMGVEAARAAGDPSGLDAIWLATSTPAYADKTNATAIHAALGLGHGGFAVDLAGAPRAAVGALRAAAAEGGLAVLSDLRTGRPGSADERDGADAAAAFRFGAADDEAIAVVLGRGSATAEFLDRWRAPGELASRGWEERFGLEQYLPLAEAAARDALDAAGLEEVDHVVVSSPHARTAAQLAERFPGRVPAAAPVTGYAGAADPGLKLADVLDRAGADETILVLVAADGADALVLRTTAALPGRRQAVPLAVQLEGGRPLRYATYLTWRGLLDREPPRRPEPDRPAAPPSARSEGWKFAFVGSRCSCGMVHVPPVRVCKRCHAVDEMTPAPLADRTGSVATFTVDRLAFSPSPPLITVVVDFDGGGRYTLEVADAGPEEIAIGTRVQPTFRRLYTVEGIHNYFWKARPVTTGDAQG